MSGRVHPIKRWRLAQNPPLDLAGMAARIPCSKPHLWKVEEGKSAPSIDFVRKLVAATGSEVTADAIIWWAPSNSCSAAA